MKITLAYGTRGLPVDLPDCNVRQVVTMGTVEPLPDPEAAVRESYRTP